MLHIITRSPFSSNSLISCLRLAQPNDAILLIEDAVLATLSPLITEAAVYALKADLEARGIMDIILPIIQVIDYEGFVDLVTQNNPIQSWN